MNLPKDKLHRKGIKLMIKVKIILFCFIVLIFNSCNFNFGNEDMKQERIKNAENSKGDIVIGAIAPWKKVKAQGNLNWYGIELATMQINGKGGINGRKIKILKKDDEASVNKGIAIAQNLSVNPDVVAVIGHAYSFISIPASVIYEFNGVVMISPAASSPKLTQRNFKFVFRVIPNDNDMGAQLAQYAAKAKLKGIMIYYIKDPYGLTLANAFEKKAEELDIDIFDRLSFDSTTKSRVFYNDFLKWKENYLFDAIFLVARTPEEGGKIIKEARKAGITVPFISGDSLNSQKLIDTGKEAVEGTVVPSNFNPFDKREVVQEFIKNFNKKFHKFPDTWSALYYDAASVLFKAIKDANSTNPVKIEKALHKIKDYNGVTGKITFKKNGDIKNKKLFFKKVVNGTFKFLNNE